MLGSCCFTSLCIWVLKISELVRDPANICILLQSEPAYHDPWVITELPRFQEHCVCLDLYSSYTHYDTCVFLFKTQSTSSDPLSKRPASSALEVEMLQIGKAIGLPTHFFFILHCVCTLWLSTRLTNRLQAQYLGNIRDTYIGALLLPCILALLLVWGQTFVLSSQC